MVSQDDRLVSHPGTAVCVAIDMEDPMLNLAVVGRSEKPALLVGALEVLPASQEHGLVAPPSASGVL